MFVKICGVTTVEDALLAAGLGADALGLNFYSGSPRRIGRETARDIVRRVPPEVLSVGVFRNEAQYLWLFRNAGQARYLGEAFNVYDAVKRTGKKFQIGSQYTSEAKWHKAAELVKAGKIGPATFAPVPVGGALVYVPQEWIRPAEGGIDQLISVYVSMGMTPPASLTAAQSAAERAT